MDKLLSRERSLYFFGGELIGLHEPGNAFEDFTHLKFR